MNTLKQAFRPAIVIIILIGIFIPIRVNAVSAINNYTLKPELVAHNLKPGSNYSGTFVVTNESLHELTLKLSVHFEHSDWIKLEKDTFAFKDGEAQTVRFNVVVPEDTAVGAYFPEIKFEEINTASPKQGQSFKIALNVFTTPPKDSLQISELSVTPFTSGPGFNITYTITNPLDLFVIPSGKLQLTDPAGKPQQSLLVNKSGEVLKPHNSITVQSVLNLPEGAILGKYTISMQLLDKQFGLGQTKQAEGIYIPSSIVLAAVVVPFAGLCGWLVWRRRRQATRRPKLPAFTPRLG